MEKTIKIHNRQRFNKLIKKKQQDNLQYITPPKIFYKNSQYYYCKRMQEKKGYQYEGDVKVMRWISQQYHQKLTKYIGGKPYAQKQSRMDKVRLKQSLNFTNQVHPILRIFSKIDRIIVKSMLQHGFQSLN